MWDHLDFHIYYQKSFSGHPPLLSSPHLRSENMVKAYFFSKKRQSHPKVTLSQKHVVSSNRKEDNPLSLIKYFVIILLRYHIFLSCQPLSRGNFSTFFKMLFGFVFMGQKIKCAMIAHFLRVAFKTHFRGYFLSCQSAYSSAFLPIMALNCASVMRVTPSSTAFLFLAVPESGVLVMR